MLLSAIGKREVPIPEHIDIYHLTREMPPSDKTPLQCVMEVDTERAMLEREAERLAHEDGKASSPCAQGTFPPFPFPAKKRSYLGSLADLLRAMVPISPSCPVLVEKSCGITLIWMKLFGAASEEVSQAWEWRGLSWW